MQFSDVSAATLGWLTANAASLLGALLAIVIGWYVAAFVYRTIVRLMPRMRGVDQNLGPLVAQVARYAVILFALVTALGFLGVNNGSLLAVLGTSGFAVVLALQNTLANIAAGIMLIWQRPIAIGEYVVGNGVAGVVVEIGLFGTRLRSTSGLYIFVPNQTLWSGAITNHSREARRRIDVNVTVPDSINVAAARKTMLKIATSDK